MTWAIEQKSYSQRRACELVGLAPSEALGNGPLDWGEQRGKWSFLL